MRPRAILPLALMLGLGVAGCSGGGSMGNVGDLVDTVTWLIPDTKKPLPGERKAVFPEGVPGVPQGVPPDLVKGNQPPPEAAAPPQVVVAPPPEAPKPKKKQKQAKAKPKPPAPPPAQDQSAWTRQP